MERNKTLNFHFTDRCNFFCKHCFIQMAGRELTLDECKRIIDKLYEMKEFSRINLAGGEPLMAQHLQEVIDYVVAKGFECSIITNGSLLTEDFIIRNKGKLSMIGISIDSMDDLVNEKIGRRTIKGISHISKLIKGQGMKLKINICVSKINIHCDFSSLIEEVQPDRVKILQVAPSPHLLNRFDYVLSNEDFEAFCNSLSQYNPICESNEYMSNAYWIVDSEGYYGKDNLHIIHSSRLKML